MRMMTPSGILTANSQGHVVMDRMAPAMPGPAAEEVAKIRTPLVVQYAGTDERINAMWPTYEAGLKAGKVAYEAHFYDGTQHGFHNNSTPRYNEKAANLAWERTVAHFRKHLA